jgi:hypothetical protein
MIHTCKLHDIDPQGLLADVLAHLADHTMASLAALLLWNWKR